MTDIVFRDGPGYRSFGKAEWITVFNPSRFGPEPKMTTNAILRPLLLAEARQFLDDLVAAITYMKTFGG